MCSPGNTQIVPIEFVRAFFVANPVLLRIPEGTCFQSDDMEPGPRQTLHQHTACASHTDDAVVHSFTFFESTHRRWKRLHGAEAVGHQ